MLKQLYCKQLKNDFLGLKKEDTSKQDKFIVTLISEAIMWGFLKSYTWIQYLIRTSNPLYCKPYPTPIRIVVWSKYYWFWIYFMLMKILFWFLIFFFLNHILSNFLYMYMPFRGGFLLQDAKWIYCIALDSGYKWTYSYFCYICRSTSNQFS